MKSQLIVWTVLFPLMIRAQTYSHCAGYFLDHKGSIRSMNLIYVSESEQSRTFDFQMYTTRNDSMTGRIRIPKGEGPFRAALLAVGIETGKDVIGLIEGEEDVLLMAADYPFEGDWDFSGWGALGTTVRLRTMAVRTVPLLLLCLDWLFQQDIVDKNEVLVVSVSFGTFTGIPAAVIDTRVKQLVVVQGGGSIATVISRNARRWGAPLPGWLAGWLGSVILSPFEPTKYIPHLAPRPLLMLNGVGDTFFPQEAADALFEAAEEPKEIVWHRTAHIMPDERELIEELTRIVVKKLYGEEE